MSYDLIISAITSGLTSGLTSAITNPTILSAVVEGLATDPSNEQVEERNMNDKVLGSRSYFFAKLVQTLFLRPITTTLEFTYHTIKLLTWVHLRVGLYAISGHRIEADVFHEKEYLKTVKAVRDILFIPVIVKRVFEDMVATRETLVKKIPQITLDAYIKVRTEKQFQQFSSYLHGCETFEVITTPEIIEFAAASDGALNTIMASDIFNPGMMAINFGTPNVATFVTEANDDGTVQTQKVDAKSMWRAPMAYHATNGKIQSGVFFVPTNLPAEALVRFKEAAEKMNNRTDITCVNTNCRVLQEAGFSIEGVAMDGVVLPNTLAEHLLFRNVFYTDNEGVKTKVRFDIINTTKLSLEEFFKEVDTAVVGTRLRHQHRNADTEENQRARGEAARALIAEQRNRLAMAGPERRVGDEYLGKRKVNVSVPSFLGDLIARFWGRHTIYDMYLTDRQQEISNAFQELAKRSNGDKDLKLRPFPQEKPSIGTRLKRDIFFSGPMIRFLRRHMMGRQDTMNLHTQDIFKHLMSTKGAHLNFVLLPDRMVIARVNANEGSDEAQRKGADWALSKHALLSGREEVFCAGEMWYDSVRNRFMMNADSGTYKPTQERVELTVRLANEILDTARFGIEFEAAEANAEAAPAEKIVDKSIAFNANLLWDNYRDNPNWHTDMPVPKSIPSIDSKKVMMRRALKEVFVKTFKQSFARSIQVIRDVARLVLKVPVRSILTPIILPRNWKERRRVAVNIKLTGYAIVQLLSVPAKFLVAVTALATSAISFKKAKQLLDKSDQWTINVDGRAAQLEALKEVGRNEAETREEFNKYKEWLYSIKPGLCRKEK